MCVVFVWFSGVNYFLQIRKGYFLLFKSIGISIYYIKGKKQNKDEVF